MKDLPWLTAAEIGAAYAARQLSPVELVRALLGEIEARNADCGAFIRIDAEGALDAARQADQQALRAVLAGMNRDNPGEAFELGLDSRQRLTQGVGHEMFDASVAAVLRQGPGPQAQHA